MLGPPPRPGWAGGQIAIEDLPALKEAWGVRMVRLSWPEGAPCIVGVFAPEKAGQV